MPPLCPLNAKPSPVEAKIGACPSRHRNTCASRRATGGEPWSAITSWSRITCGCSPLAAEAWDRSQEARETAEREGAYYEDRFGQPKAHPAVAVERDSRIAFARLMRELDLDGAPAPDPRPPRVAERR